jgi:hypothetical protein
MGISLKIDCKQTKQMKSVFPTLLVLFSTIGTWAQVSVNINDNKDVSNAQKQIAKVLMNYYKPNSVGSIPQKESEGPDGFQWFEMGFLCKIYLTYHAGMAVAQYMDVGDDITFMETFSGALGNASFGRHASFLGPKNLLNFSAATGKWNDDILWWGIAGIL